MMMVIAHSIVWDVQIVHWIEEHSFQNAQVSSNVNFQVEASE